MSLPLQVQIRPWNLSDSDFVMDGSQPLDPRKTIFVGGVPRPLRASKSSSFVSRGVEDILQILLPFRLSNLQHIS